MRKVTFLEFLDLPIRTVYITVIETYKYSKFGCAFLRSRSNYVNVSADVRASAAKERDPVDRF